MAGVLYAPLKNTFDSINMIRNNSKIPFVVNVRKPLIVNFILKASFCNHVASYDSPTFSYNCPGTLKQIVEGSVFLALKANWAAI